MSNPPSFTPDPKRRRPGSDDAHVVGEEVRGGAPTPPPEALAPQMWRISDDEASAAPHAGSAAEGLSVDFPAPYASPSAAVVPAGLGGQPAVLRAGFRPLVRLRHVRAVGHRTPTGDDQSLPECTRAGPRAGRSRGPGYKAEATQAPPSDSPDPVPVPGPRPRVGRIPHVGCEHEHGARERPVGGSRHSGHDLPAGGFRLARRRRCPGWLQRLRTRRLDHARQRRSERTEGRAVDPA